MLGLAERSDVAVQNFRPGWSNGWHFDTVAARNPDVTTLGLQPGADGPGTSGPCSIRWSRVSLASCMARSANHSFPTLSTLVADKATAHGRLMITAALLLENAAGGQHIELSMLDATLAWFWPTAWPTSPIARARSDQPPVRPVQLVDTLDGQLVYFLAASHSSKGWRALGRDDLSPTRTSATWASHRNRGCHRGAAILTGLGQMTISRWSRHLPSTACRPGQHDPCAGV